MTKKRVDFDPKECYLLNNCIKEWIPAIELNRKNIRVKKNDLLFSEGDEVRGVYFVNSGIVKVHKKWDADKDLIIRFAKAGAIFGHRGLGGTGIYPVSATVIQPGIISFIDMDFFEATVKVNPNFTYKLLMFFADELRESERRMRNLAHMPVKGRIAEALLLLEKQFGQSDQRNINVVLSRQDLASFAGTTYETVFRVMNDLTNEKLIITNSKSIEILNKEGLMALTQGFSS